MQDAFKHHAGDAHEPKDPRDNPIEQTNTPTDPNVDPAAVTNPTKPPYYGDPQGGGGSEDDQ